MVKILELTYVNDLDQIDNILEAISEIKKLKVDLYTSVHIADFIARLENEKFIEILDNGDILINSTLRYKIKAENNVVYVWDEKNYKRLCIVTGTKYNSEIDENAQSILAKILFLLNDKYFARIDRIFGKQVKDIMKLKEVAI